MTSDLDSVKESPTELRRRRVFRIRLWSATAGYLLVTAALSFWGRNSAVLRITLAVASVILVAVIVAIVVHRVRQLDEYQRKLLFPGIAVGFTVTIFAAITVGTLASAGIPVPNAGWPVALVGVVAWEVTNLLVKAPLA
jgi:hypothetical protein